MNPEPEDILWQRISKTLFNTRRHTDESLFTYRVMEEVRRVAAALPDPMWPRFLRWAVPALGVGVASLVLATRTPAFSTPRLLETALFHQQSLNEDPLNPFFEELR